MEREVPKVEAALIQKDLDSGLTKRELTALIDLVDAEPNDELDLLIVEGEHCVAQGVISLKASDEKLKFNTIPFSDRIRAVLDDVNLETESGLYDILGVNTLILYDI